MAAPRIAVLDASLGDTPAERNFRREVPGSVDVFKVSEGELPPPVESRAEWPYDGVIISGSQSSVYEDLSWIRDVEDWMQGALRASVPILGVCWGHQLIAKIGGGRVEDLGQYEIGYRPIEVTGDSELFDGFPDEFVAFETHSDAVVELPPVATELARNDVTVQAFSYGSSYGVQFHPEYDLETARWILDNKDLSEERERTARENLTKEMYERARVATGVFDNFRTLVLGRVVE